MSDLALYVNTTLEVFKTLLKSSDTDSGKNKALIAVVASGSAIAGVLLCCCLLCYCQNRATPATDEKKKKPKAKRACSSAVQLEPPNLDRRTGI
jgi:hypothetical protein